MIELISDLQIAQLRSHIGSVYEGALLYMPFDQVIAMDSFDLEFSSGSIQVGGEDGWLDSLDVEHLEFFQFRVNPDWPNKDRSLTRIDQYAGQVLKDVKLIETTLKGTTPIPKGWSLTLDTGIVFELEAGFVSVSAENLNPIFMNMNWSESLDISNGQEFESLREAFNYSRESTYESKEADIQVDSSGAYFDYSAKTRLITLDEAAKREPKVSI